MKAGILSRPMVNIGFNLFSTFSTCCKEICLHDSGGAIADACRLLYSSEELEEVGEWKVNESLKKSANASEISRDEPNSWLLYSSLVEVRLFFFCLLQISKNYWDYP